jgi:hypothetical protein
MEERRKKVEEDERVVEKKKGEDKEGEVGPTYSLG